MKFECGKRHLQNNNITDIKETRFQGYDISLDVGGVAEATKTI